MLKFIDFQNLMNIPTIFVEATFVIKIWHGSIKVKFVFVFAAKRYLML